MLFEQASTRTAAYMFMPLLLILACRQASVSPPPASIGLEVPRLPSPEALVYTMVLSQPRDVAVAMLAHQLPWDESLSGAAGAMAMDAMNGTDPDLWTARWAALRAGFPYPVLTVRLQVCPMGCFAQDLMADLRQELQPGHMLGLARARGGEADYWVGLVGRADIRLAPVSRELPVGGSITLLEPDQQAPAGAEVILVSPAGELWSKALDSKPFSLGEDGEWWVHISAAGRVLAAFPVYVGVDAAASPPFPASVPVPAGDLYFADPLYLLLDEARDMFDWPRPERDPILQGVARARLESLLHPQERSTPDWPVAPSSCRASLSCELEPGQGIERCFRDWYVQPGTRAALLNPRCDLAGAAGSRTDGGAVVVVELGEE